MGACRTIVPGRGGVDDRRAAVSEGLLEPVRAGVGETRSARTVAYAHSSASGRHPRARRSAILHDHPFRPVVGAHDANQKRRRLHTGGDPQPGSRGPRAPREFVKSTDNGHPLWRRARNGSTRTARMAGMALAAVQISIIPAAAARNVRGSVALTPNNWPASRRLIARHPTSPPARPTAAARSPWFVTS